MNLREQIQKEITDKVMTKLASVKVELVGATDIKKITAQVEKGQKDVASKLKEFKEIKNELKKAKEKAAKLQSNTNKVHIDLMKIVSDADLIIDRVTNIAEDLGVNLNDVKGLNNLIKLNRNLERNADSLFDFDFDLD